MLAGRDPRLGHRIVPDAIAKRGQYVVHGLACRRDEKNVTEASLVAAVLLSKLLENIGVRPSNGVLLPLRGGRRAATAFADARVTLERFGPVRWREVRPRSLGGFEQLGQVGVRPPRRHLVRPFARGETGVEPPLCIIQPPAA